MEQFGSKIQLLVLLITKLGLHEEQFVGVFAHSRQLKEHFKQFPSTGYVDEAHSMQYPLLLQLMQF